MKKLSIVIFLFLIINSLHSQVPGIPIIISPSDSATLCPPYLFDWNDVPTATSYEIRFSTNQSFTQIIVDQIINESQYILPGGVLSTYSYCYWIVRAINNYGNGSWTAVRRVKINALTNPPVLLTPINNIINVSINPVFKWNKVTGATSYKLLISNQSSYDTIYTTDSVYSGHTLQYYTVYYWRVIGINSCGPGNSSTVFNFRTVSSSKINIISTEIPSEYKLHNNYPNPFNPNTIIKYQITNSSKTSLVIYNVTGKEIVTLVNEKQSPGIYEVAFDAGSLPSGVYFYRLQSGDFVDTKKMLMIK